MTSELLIMNSSAVALAADSVVTVDNRKTYTGVNKLFMLSNNPPMGIMTYNLATFLGIPLETIIKEFRKEISEKDIHSIFDFKEEFEKFLNNIVIKSNYQIHFIDRVNLFIEIARKDYNRLTFNEFKDVIYGNANSLNSEGLDQFYEETLSLLDENIKPFEDFLIEIDKYSDDFLNVFKKCFLNYLFFNNWDYVGIVIAGFEHERMFPSSIDFKVNYLYNDKFILMDVNECYIESNGSVVKPFAQ